MLPSPAGGPLRQPGEAARPDSDLDVAAWWAGRPPRSWELDLPAGVDLVVLNRAPLWLAGRIALQGRLLFDDDPTARVTWQADTRRIWLDERPQILHSQREFRRAVAETWSMRSALPGSRARCAAKRHSAGRP